MARPKGTQKTGGRQKGTPNKTTSAVKGYISEVLNAYMKPSRSRSNNGKPNLQEDLEAMLPDDRVRAITQLAGYVIPKQQALSIEEQTTLEKEALLSFLEDAPEDAIDAIAAKIMEIQTQASTNS